MARWLGIVIEDTFGTPEAAPDVSIDCLSIGLHPEREIVDSESSATVGTPNIGPGSYKIVGDVEIIPSSTNIMRFLYLLMGEPSTDDDGSSHYQHTFVPSDTLVFGTMWKADDYLPDATNCVQYTSVTLTEMRLEAALNAPVSATFGCLGQKDAKVALPAIGTISAINQFFSHQGKVYWDIAESSEETSISSISINYSREVPDDVVTMNDPFLAALIPGAAKLEGSMDLLFNSWTAYGKFWGAAAAPISTPAAVAIELELIGPSLGGAGDYEYHTMKVLIPKALLSTINDPFENRDKIMQTVEFKAAREAFTDGAPSGSTGVCAVILTNAEATA